MKVWQQEQRLYMFGNESIEQVFAIKMKIKDGKGQEKNKQQKNGSQNKGDHWQQVWQ